MPSEEDIEWLQTVVLNRGSYNICRRKTRNGPREYQYEARVIFVDKFKHRLARIKKILGGGQLSRLTDPAMKRGYKWHYYGNTAQVRTLMKLVVIPSRKHAIMRKFMTSMNPPGRNRITNEQYNAREECYDAMKKLNAKGWGE